MERIEYHRYTLHSRDPLNARSSRREHEGALIRIDGGHGCIHPWPELGDLRLDDQIELLKQGETSPLIESAFRCAEADGIARAAGKLLIEGSIPRSHWLISPGDEPTDALREQFDVAKLKVGRDLEKELRISKRWMDVGLKLRFDCNEKLSVATFLEFWEALGSWKEFVDLVEDPVAWSQESWQILREGGVPIAVDQNLESRHVNGDIAVLKPARSSWIPSPPNRCYVTSYMDHALGQMWSAAEAARLERELGSDRMLVCGLLTHKNFEKDEFFERLNTNGPRLLRAAGTGLGFDDLLEKLPWKRLN